MIDDRSTSAILMLIDDALEAANADAAAAAILLIDAALCVVTGHYRLQEARGKIEVLSAYAETQGRAMIAKLEGHGW